MSTEPRPGDVSRYFQSVVITCGDGSVYVFTGRVMAWDDTEAAARQGIKDIKFSKPGVLPEGGYWQEQEVKP